MLVFFFSVAVDQIRAVAMLPEEFSLLRLVLSDVGVMLLFSFLLLFLFSSERNFFNESPRQAVSRRRQGPTAR